MVVGMEGFDGSGGMSRYGLGCSLGKASAIEVSISKNVSGWVSLNYRRSSAQRRCRAFPVCITVYAGIMNTKIQCLQCGTDARKRVRLVLGMNKNLRRVADRDSLACWAVPHLLVAVIRYGLSMPAMSSAARAESNPR